MRIRHKSAARVAVAVGALWVARAHALEWDAVPVVVADASSDSNIRLSAADATRASGASVATALEVAAIRPGFNFSLRPEVRARRYADDAEADRNDAFAAFGVGLDRPTRSIRFGGNYARESTLTSDFEQNGFTGVDAERLQRGLDTRFRRTLSPASNVGIAVQAFDISYGDPLESLLSDYRYRTLELTHGRATGEHSTWAFTASKSFIHDELRDRDSTSTAVQADWLRQLSPRLQLSLGFGAFAVDSQSAESDKPSGSFDFSVVRQGDGWSLSAEGARSVRPDHWGALAVEDSITLQTQRRVAERVSVSFSVRGARLNWAADQLEYERSYSQTGVRVQWQASRRLSVDAGLYQRTETTTLSRRADGLASVVSVSYRGS